MKVSDIFPPTLPNLKTPPKLKTRRDLARFLGVRYKTLTYVLYKLDRAESYAKFEIGKASGGTRTLHAVKGRLKWLQRRALDRLQARWHPSAYAHGFVPGHSIISNAEYHKGKRLILKIDIEDFFPSISFPRVRGLFLAPPFKFEEEAATTLAQLACLDEIQGSSLPQGGVLSPYIANMICRRLDARLAAVAREYRCHFTRYADDITFSTNNVARIDYAALLKSIYEVVEAEHFTPNKSKTRTLTPRDRQVVTGIVVNDGLNVNRKYLRNIRATLRNCEKDGIESQVVKPGGFRDDRASRTAIQKFGEQYFIGSIEITKDDACRHFLRHLLGKIIFLGYVVQSNDQFEAPERYRRVLAYHSLLLRFLELVRKDQRFRGIKKTVEKRIRLIPNLKAEESLRKEQADVKTKALEEYRSTPAARDLMERLDKARDRADLERLRSDMARTDARYFGFALPPDTEEARRKLKKYIEYPPFDQDKTIDLLRALKGSTTSLGPLTHEDMDQRFCAERAFKLLSEYFDPVYYFVPTQIRPLFDDYIEGLKRVVLERGADSYVKVMDDPILGKCTNALKIGTRFGGHPSDASNLEDAITKAIEHAEEKVKDPRATVVKQDVKPMTFYTHVDSISKALNIILRSMLKNSRGDEITVNTFVDDGKTFGISISDNFEDSIDQEATRNFANGKLAKAVELTNGLCDYWIQARFYDGKRYRIVMHTDDVRVEPGDGTGFKHQLRFRI